MRYVGLCHAAAGAAQLTRMPHHRGEQTPWRVAARGQFAGAVGRAK
jgi:hypothetical protein